MTWEVQKLYQGRVQEGTPWWPMHAARWIKWEAGTAGCLFMGRGLRPDFLAVLRLRCEKPDRACLTAWSVPNVSEASELTRPENQHNALRERELLFQGSSPSSCLHQPFYHFYLSGSELPIHQLRNGGPQCPRLGFCRDPIACSNFATPSPT